MYSSLSNLMILTSVSNSTSSEFKTTAFALQSFIMYSILSFGVFGATGTYAPPVFRIPYIPTSISTLLSVISTTKSSLPIPFDFSKFPSLFAFALNSAKLTLSSSYFITVLSPTFSAFSSRRSTTVLSLGYSFSVALKSFRMISFSASVVASISTTLLSGFSAISLHIFNILSIISFISFSQYILGSYAILNLTSPLI